MAGGIAGLLPTNGLKFTESGYKSINTSGGYHFSIDSKTDFVAVYDDYYGTFGLYYISQIKQEGIKYNFCTVQTQVNCILEIALFLPGQVGRPFLCHNI